MKYVLFIMLIAISVGACKNSIKEVEDTAEHYEPAKETGKNIELTYYESGHVKVKLTAPKIIRAKTKDPYIEFPKGLLVRFYNDSLNLTSTLRANYGIRYEKEHKTYFRDSVQLKNIADEKLETEELIWDENKSTIYTDKFVKVITPDERITGKGFEADQEFKNWTIKNITGQVYVQRGKTDENF